MPDDAPDQTQRPDAILVPEKWPQGVEGQRRLQSFRERFAPVLGVEAVHSRHVADQKATLVTRTPDDHYYYAKDHPRHPACRFEWRDAGDGVQHGFLRADDDPAGMSESEKARLFDAMAMTPEGQGFLSARRAIAQAMKETPGA